MWANKKTRLQLFRTLFNIWLLPTYTFEDIYGQMLDNNSLVQRLFINELQRCAMEIFDTCPIQNGGIVLLWRFFSFEYRLLHTKLKVLCSWVHIALLTHCFSLFHSEHLVTSNALINGLSTSLLWPNQFCSVLFYIEVAVQCWGTVQRWLVTSLKVANIVLSLIN